MWSNGNKLFFVVKNRFDTTCLSSHHGLQKYFHHIKHTNTIAPAGGGGQASFLAGRELSVIFKQRDSFPALNSMLTVGRL